MNFQPRMFLEISVLSAHHTLQRSDVFLKGFQIATHAVSHGGVSEFAFGFWWVYFLWEEERWVFLALIYFLITQAETKKEQKEYFCSAHVTVHLLDLAPCGLRDISLVITR